MKNQILSSELAEILRSKCDDSKKRLYIVSPFIGNWEQVRRIIGVQWMRNPNVKLRLITDIDNHGFIAQDTFAVLAKKAEIKTLRGLHAKMYIVDNDILVTSANLSGTAFSRRYEVGFLLKFDVALEKLFDKWWNLAKPVDKSWRPAKSPGKKQIEKEAGNIEGLKILNSLPESPSETNLHKDFYEKLYAFEDFKSFYLKNVQRIWQNVPIYHEIDSFLNYLFHEHPSRPTYEFMKKTARLLNEKEKTRELKKFHKEFIQWSANHSTTDGELIRNDKLKFIQSKLKVDAIDQLKGKDLKEIIDRFHCMNSLPVNKAKFLNPLNNKLNLVKKEWKHLLYDNKLPHIERMERCNEKLKYFGKSSIYELISYIDPDNFPIINTNSISGLKFFGYDLKTY